MMTTITNVESRKWINALLGTDTPLQQRTVDSRQAAGRKWINAFLGTDTVAAWQSQA